MKINGSFSFNKSEREFLKKLNIDSGGKAQSYIDAAVIRCCEPYVPFRTGVLARSAQTSTVIGSGEVVYNTPYASNLYYNPQYNFGTTFPTSG